MPVLRLDKFICDLGLATRSMAKVFIRSGRVTVNGAGAKPEQKVDPASDVVRMDGLVLEYSEFATFMMNKPAGLVSATEDDRERTVTELLNDREKRLGLFPAGRLDKDTVGLLILTNDGELAHRIISPSSKIVKTYQATVSRPIKPEAVGLFAEGLILADGTKCLPASLEVAEGGKSAIVGVHEGRYHQVKRMLAAVGSPVVSLKRLSIGGLQLDPELGPGEYKKLTVNEIAIIFNMAITN